MDLLAALLSGDWAVADVTDERCRREANGIVAAYSQYHLERALRSLRMVDRTAPAEPAARADLPAPADADQPTVTEGALHGSHPQA